MRNEVEPPNRQRQKQSTQKVGAKLISGKCSVRKHCNKSLLAPKKKMTKHDVKEYLWLKIITCTQTKYGKVEGSGQGLLDCTRGSLGWNAICNNGKEKTVKCDVKSGAASEVQPQGAGCTYCTASTQRGWSRLYQHGFKKDAVFFEKTSHVQLPERPKLKVYCGLTRLIWFKSYWGMLLL